MTYKELTTLRKQLIEKERAASPEKRQEIILDIIEIDKKLKTIEKAISRSTLFVGYTKDC